SSETVYFIQLSMCMKNGHILCQNWLSGHRKSRFSDGLRGVPILAESATKSTSDYSAKSKLVSILAEATTDPAPFNSAKSKLPGNSILSGEWP
ncbi:MAG: hypothetical protein LKG80_10950, partial [Lachnospiraceae bacterium]|nr:hypothetical protein [Lachnospiraceae bacterium]MCI1556765.1 hypothetical protein [Lachnospiraceae bacterium]